MSKIHSVVQKIASNKAITNTYMYYNISHKNTSPLLKNTSTCAQFFVDNSMNNCMDWVQIKTNVLWIELGMYRCKNLWKSYYTWKILKNVFCFEIVDYGKNKIFDLGYGVMYIVYER